MTCRCADLAAAFGLVAPPECGPCAESRERERLTALGFAVVESASWAHGFQDCGVPVEKVGQAFLAPAWAVELYDAAGEAPIGDQLMAAAAADSAFREECLTIIQLARYRDPVACAATALRQLEAHAAQRGHLR